MRLNPVLAISLAVLLAPLAACHSSRIQATVENRTGAPLHLLEVDYPSASFGANLLAPGETLDYAMALRGSGQIHIQYGQGPAEPVRIEGPQLAEGQQGSLRIILLPDGKADFEPHLSPH